MTGAPWSVKGIDPKAREVAKDLARRSGMTLGEWLNHMILEDESPEDVFSEAQVTPRPMRPYYETPRERESAPSRYEVSEHPADEIGRVIRALDRLTERVETSETHTGLAIGGVEHSVREAVARIEAGERDHVAVAARFEGAVSEVADTQARLAERIRRIESEAAGPRSAEALRSLERALGKVANHLYEGENRTRALIETVEARVERVEGQDITAPVDAEKLIEAVVDRVGERLAQAEARTASALEGLRDSFAALDARLNAVEGEGGGQRFEQLAANLTARVEASRADIAEKLRGAADGRFDRMERTLGEVAQQVRVAEQGSAQAIERMGREIKGMADTLNLRVQAVEHRSAEAIEQVGGEMARIAQAMESRLGRADVVHAQALEKLGGEIARITERLAERIGAAERRSAQAVDDVIEQVSRSNERASQHHERTAGDLAERIRLSEERTARLLDEARAKIDQGMAETQRRLDHAARVSPVAVEDLTPFADLGPAEPDPLAVAPEAPAGGDAFAAYAAFAKPAAAAFTTPASFKAFPEDAPFPTAEAPSPPAFDIEDFEAADAFVSSKADEAAFAKELAGVDEPERAPEETVGRAGQPDVAEIEHVVSGENLPEVEALNEALDAAEATAKTSVATTPVGFSSFAFDDAAARDDAAAEETGEPEKLPTFADVFATATARASAPLDSGAPAKDEAAAEARAEPGYDDPWRMAEGPSDAKAGDQHDHAAPESFEITTPRGQADVAPAPEPARPLTTREVVEQARAAARAAQANDPKRGKVKAEKPASEGGGLFASFGMRPKRRAGSKLQVALMLTGGAAALSVATAGFVLDGRPAGDPPKRVADAIALSGDAPAQPRASVALAPAPLADALAAGPTDPSQDLPALYAEALRGVEAGEPGAVDALRKVANLGYPRAQFHLAKLYEAGGGGLAKDLVESRRWTERAARGGDREAMHNFALQQFFGDGGAKDPVAAAEWFRRAADLGLVDSQYNLARLYEDGVGVGRNLAESYKWYLIAAKSGDPDSKNSARRVRAKLSPDAQNVTERAAASFRSAMPGPTTDVAMDGGGQATTSSVVTAQRALSRLGYYQGPSDGAASTALRLAVAAYQRDQGLGATGALDDTTVSRLAVFTR